ncbi:sugar ABC transporter ATP-binding protein [Bradyrhizobium sp. LTSPM299]|uniref:sugar ABC transporter ATP-binding protein n=1 Tax=Bradyrhizobium sp. LTSPM299 TaxID=1619233 RepID=UPI000679E1AF|nr:sugar ABC transporter ATP-binding protein [Bradyrhizobium sp. LTSPM299]
MDFELRTGEVHVLLGENGAGKSTIINIVTGLVRADQGEVIAHGRSLLGLSPHRIRQMGISAVFQEFSLVPGMKIEENLFLGQERTAYGRLSKSAMRDRARRVLDDLGFDRPVDRSVELLSRAEQQMVEIAKALLNEVSLLILDEPTASLTNAEAEKLFGIIERLRDKGVGIIYVTHRMPEIQRLADRVTVLRDGRRVATIPAGAKTDEELIELMTGRPVALFYPSIAHNPQHLRLATASLSLHGGAVEQASIEVRAGEVVGIAGLAGCGKSELARAVFGLEAVSSGSLSMDGGVIARPSPATMLDRGLCYFTSDRVKEGLSLNRPIRENIAMASFGTRPWSRFGLLDRRAERQRAQAIATRLNIRPLDVQAPAGRLSGGNRQKVLLARGLTRDVGVFVFDEPTVGIDVGAKLEVYAFIREITEAGAAVLLVSSDLPEILHVTHRAYVMCQSRVVAHLPRAAFSETALLRHFFTTDGENRTAPVLDNAGGAR